MDYYKDGWYYYSIMVDDFRDSNGNKIYLYAFRVWRCIDSYKANRISQPELDLNGCADVLFDTEYFLDPYDAFNNSDEENIHGIVLCLNSLVAKVKGGIK